VEFNVRKVDRSLATVVAILMRRDHGTEAQRWRSRNKKINAQVRDQIRPAALSRLLKKSVASAVEA
jgi:hypothetical protein